MGAGEQKEEQHKEKPIEERLQEIIKETQKERQKLEESKREFEEHKKKYEEFCANKNKEFSEIEKRAQESLSMVMVGLPKEGVHISRGKEKKSKIISGIKYAITGLIGAAIAGGAFYINSLYNYIYNSITKPKPALQSEFKAKPPTSIKTEKKEEWIEIGEYKTNQWIEAGESDEWTEIRKAESKDDREWIEVGDYNKIKNNKKEQAKEEKEEKEEWIDAGKYQSEDLETKLKNLPEQTGQISPAMPTLVASTLTSSLATLTSASVAPTNAAAILNTLAQSSTKSMPITTTETKKDGSAYAVTLSAGQQEVIKKIRSYASTEEKKKAIYEINDLEVLINLYQEFDKGNGDAQLREALIKKLEGSSDQKVIKILKSASKDNDYAVSLIANCILIRYGYGDSSREEKAANALKDYKNFEERLERPDLLVYAIGAIKDKKYLPNVKELRNAKSETVRKAAEIKAAELER
jgi:hypothetical protein